MATSRINIGGKFQNTDIPSQDDFKEIFDSFVHKDEDKANFQMVETGTDDQHYVTPALLRTGLQNIGIITGNSYMPFKEHFDNFIGNTLPLRYSPVKFSAKAFKNGQLLLEKDLEGNEGDYIINYDTAVITFSSDVDNRNIEVDYWYKNLSPNPGGGSTPQIDFTSFLHTSGNETKNGLLTFNNTTPTSTSGIVLTNSGTGSAATSLDVTNSGTGSGISLQNSSTGTGVKVSNAGAGVAVNLNSATGSTGDILQVAKNNVVQTKIDSEGIITAPKFVTAGGLRSQFIKGDGFPDPTVYAEDTKVIHTEGNELRDGALNLTHDDAVQDVLTITKNNSANCLKLVQNSSSNATTSTFDTTTENVNRKAISIQKVHVEKAFITHEGNVSGTSFTTLNEKADITGGFLTLGGSDSPAAMSGHAKLYAKTDGTTDMYVMGSDGVEKKIGGVVDLSGKENTIAPGTNTQYYRGDKSWQTLDKTAVGLANVDNTSDLNKPVSTATQAALNAKQATLVSGSNIKTINGVSVVGSGDIIVSAGGATITGTANKIAKFNSTGNNVTDSNISDNGSLVTISKPTTIDSGTNDNSGLTLSKLTTPTTNSEIPVATGLSSSSSTAVDNSSTFSYTIEWGGTIRKINLISGINSLLPLTGLTIPDGSYGNNICIDSTGNLYVTSNAKVFKIDSSYEVTLFATIADYTTDIIFSTDGNLYVVNIWGKLTKITLSGISTTISDTTSPDATCLCQDTQGNFYIASGNYKDIYKVAAGTNFPVLFYTHSKNILSLISKNSNSLWILNNGGSNSSVDQLYLASKTVSGNTIPLSIIIPQDGFIDQNETLYVVGNKKDNTNNIILEKIVTPTAKVLKTDSNGLIVKTTYLEDVQYLKPTDIDLSSYVKLNSPSFSGVPTAPTAIKGTNTTQIATTSFVVETLNAKILSNTFVANVTNRANINVLTSGVVSSWTRIGDIVTVTAHLEFNFIAGNVTSSLNIDLPFTATNSVQQINIGISNLVSQDGFFLSGIIQRDTFTKAVVSFKPRINEVSNAYFGTAIFSYTAIPLS